MYVAVVVQPDTRQLVHQGDVGGSGADSVDLGAQIDCALPDAFGALLFVAILSGSIFQPPIVVSNLARQ